MIKIMTYQEALDKMELGFKVRKTYWSRDIYLRIKNSIITICKKEGNKIKYTPVNQDFKFNFGGKWVIYDKECRGM